MSNDQEASQKGSRKKGDTTNQRTPAGGGQSLEVDRAFEDAFRKYQRTLQDVWADYQDRLQEGYTGYVRTVQDTARAENRMTAQVDAQRSFTNAQQDALTDYLSRSEEALYQYLEALRDAWATVDVRNINPSSLATVGQHLLWSASCAAAQLNRQS